VVQVASRYPVEEDGEAAGGGVCGEGAAGLRRDRPQCGGGEGGLREADEGVIFGSPKGGTDADGGGPSLEMSSE